MEFRVAGGFKFAVSAWAQRYCSGINTNDIIQMEVDINKGSLKYYINNEDQGICFDSISFKDNEVYHMAVTLSASDQIVKISDFQQY